MPSLRTQGPRVGNTVARFVSRIRRRSCSTWAARSVNYQTRMKRNMDVNWRRVHSPLRKSTLWYGMTKHRACRNNMKQTKVVCEQINATLRARNCRHEFPTLMLRCCESIAVFLLQESWEAYMLLSCTTQYIFTYSN